VKQVFVVNPDWMVKEVHRDRLVLEEKKVNLVLLALKEKEGKLVRKESVDLLDQLVSVVL